MRKFISRNFKYFFGLGETIRFCGEACHIDGAFAPAAFPLQTLSGLHERSDPPRHASKHPRWLPPRRTRNPPRPRFEKMEHQGILALAWGVETRGLAALKKQRGHLVNAESGDLVQHRIFEPRRDLACLQFQRPPIGDFSQPGVSAFRIVGGVVEDLSPVRVPDCLNEQLKRFVIARSDLFRRNIMSVHCHPVRHAR